MAGFDFVGAADIPAPNITGSEMTEEERLNRRRYREMAYRRFMKPTYVMFHEELQKFMALAPGVWLHQSLQDWVRMEALREIAVKSRQIRQTSKSAMQLLDIGRWMPGSTTLIWNMNHAAAEATLKSKVSEVLQQTYPRFAADLSMCSMSASHVWIKRKFGHGGDSFIYAGKVTGRGGTPVMTLATEFPQVCAIDEQRASEHIHGTVSGAQFGTHVLEGTASHMASGELMNDMFLKAMERQRKGFLITQETWTGYYYPFWCVPNRFVPDERWDSREKWSKDFDDYLKKLTDPATEYMIGRDVRKGGIPLNEGQKRFLWRRFHEDKNESFEQLWADYSALPSESLKVGTKAHYLTPLIRRARDEGRVDNFPVIHGTPVHVGTDIGWNDEDVAIFAQKESDGDKWRILGSFAQPQQSSLEFIERIKAYNWKDKTGYKPIVWLPHDAGRHTDTNRKKTGSDEITVYDDFVDDGYFEVRDPVRQPAKKSDVFSDIREAFPKFNFDRDNTRELFGNLRTCRIMEVKKGGALSTQLEKTTGRHHHDALGILAFAVKFRGRRARGARRGDGARYIRRRAGFSDSRGKRRY